MSVFARIAALLAVVVISQTAQSATYYIDAVNGSDSNAGTSTSFPKKTIKGMTTIAPIITILPGDTINLMGKGPYQDPAVTGRNVVFGTNWSGNSTTVVTVQSEPGGGQKAVIDPGFPEFMATPNTAWVPCTESGAHPDEYISTATYTSNPLDGAFGSFLLSNGQAGTRLLTYTRVEDLRATNESFALVPYDGIDAHGRPAWGNTSMMYRWAYRGPGLWLDTRPTIGGVTNPNYKKIHFRASSTHMNQPGIVDYVSTPSSTVGTDPRNTPLSVCLYPHSAVNIQADHITFKNIVIQNGGGAHDAGRIEGTSGNYVEKVTFDHCFFYPGRNGFSINFTKFAKFSHCFFDGKLGSYVSRSDVKDDFSFVDYDGVTQASDGLCRMTQVCLFQDGGVNEDLEIANCEFRNGHDGIQFWGIRPRVHHCLLENLNDEGIMFYGNVAVTDGRIYNNVIRKTMQPLSSSQGSLTSTGARYIYRNIIDQRVPILGYRQLPPDTLMTWRVGQDFKMNTPFPEMYVYQNTFVMPAIDGNECSVVWGNILSTQQWTRRYMNNIYMSLQMNAPFYIIPFDPNYPNRSNGNNWHRRLTNATMPMFKWYNTSGQTTTLSYNTLADWLASPQQASYVAANGVGWETNSRTVYPQFNNVSDWNPTDGGTFFNQDYRIKSTSPDRYTGAGTGGVTLPPPPSGSNPPDATHWPDSATYTSTPDVGALPYNSAAMAVGVDGLKVFPDAVTPIAEAGDYTTASDTDNTGFDTIAFTSTGSSDPNGSISSYNWVYNGTSISTASSFSKDLPIGTHQVYLTVTDNSSATAKDMREVTITDPTWHDNIVRNAGFENGSTSWTLTRAGPVVNSPTHFGAGTMKFIGQALYISAIQDVPVVAGASTKFSLWLKTDTIPAAAKAKLQVLWLDAALTPLTSFYPANNIGGTTGWTYYTSTQTAPANAAFARISAMLDSAATGGFAYFDDIRVMITDSKIKNGSFERNGFTNWTQVKDIPSITTTVADTHAGPQALHCPAQTQYYQMYQDFTASATVSYNVQGWIKTNAIGAGQSAVIWLEWYDATNTKIGSTQGVGAALTGTNPYTLRQATLVAPANTSYGRVILRTTGLTGSTTWFDDVYVK